MQNELLATNPFAEEKADFLERHPRIRMVVVLFLTAFVGMAVLGNGLRIAVEHTNFCEWMQEQSEQNARFWKYKWNQEKARRQSEESQSQTTAAPR